MSDDRVVDLMAALEESVERARAARHVETIEDGFGNEWENCHVRCTQEVVRPGKVQCNGLSTDITDERGRIVYEPCPWGNTP